MGPYLALNAALVGAFGSAAIYHVVLWSQSRRDIVLPIFALHCMVLALFSANLVTLATATTLTAGQRALDIRLDLGLVGQVTSVWVLSIVGGVRARWFVWSITAAFVVGAVANVAFEPLTGIVTASERVVTSWGEEISTFHRESPSRLLAGYYALSLAINAFGYLCSARLWAHDRIGGLLLALSNSAGVAVGLLALRIDTASSPQPYLGNIHYPVWVLLVAMQIAREHRLRAERLEAAEQRFHAIFDQTFQFIGIVALDGTLLQANATSLGFAGVRAEDVIGRPFWETPWWAHSPELQRRLHEAVRSAAAGATVRFEATHRGADGELHWVDFSLKPVRNEQGGVVLLIPEGRDITERKEAQRALEDSREQLKRLADGLLVAREEERGTIAREVHDVLGQALTALKMDTGWLQSRVSKATVDLHARLNAMSSLLDEAVVTVRRIATELRPGVLDDLGLAAAVEWQSQQFERRTGIPCSFTSRVGNSPIDPLVSTALFRIVQESLTNVARHSGASHVAVTLEHCGQDLLLEVRDNGIGITPDHAANAQSIGLAGMRERAQLVGGVFAISGVAGAGTTVRVGIPSRAEAMA